MHSESNIQMQLVKENVVAAHLHEMEITKLNQSLTWTVFWKCWENGFSRCLAKLLLVDLCANTPEIEFHPCRIFCDKEQLIEQSRKAHQQFQAPFILYKTAFLEPRPP